MLGQAQVCEDPVGHGLHSLGSDGIGGVKVDRQVVHGRLDLEVGVGRGLHERRGHSGIVSAEVSAGGPRHALGLFARATEHEVADEGGKTPARG